MHEYVGLPSFQFPLAMWKNKSGGKGEPFRGGMGREGEDHLGGVSPRNASARPKAWDRRDDHLRAGEDRERYRFVGGVIGLRKHTTSSQL